VYVADERELRRFALSCLVLGWEGREPPRWLLDALADGLGGVILFTSNLADGASVLELTERLRAAAGRDIVIGVDEEGGVVTRLDAVGGSRSPGAAALGHLDDPEATEDVYRYLGARCAEAGVTLNLAPVADVNLDPLNPVIGLRAFGADGAAVAKHVAAATRGIQSAGVAACAKHFPGHGATSQDSHHEATVLDRSREQIERVEFAPFRAAIEAGTRAVMTGHLTVPALDPDRLATVSRPITHDLLRGELGFTGTVVTDALEMKALAEPIGIVDGFVQSIAAGADCVETGALDYPELVEAIPAAAAAAVAAGQLDPDRLEDAARRTAALAHVPARVTPSAPDADLAVRCLEVSGSFPTLHRPVVVECHPRLGMASGSLTWSFGAPLAALVPDTDTVVADRSVDIEPGASTLVLVICDPYRHEWQFPMLDAARRRGNAVVVDVGWPVEHLDLPTIRTRGVAPLTLQAAARVLAGIG
jgi:beta-N-acetylhexosaminidase